MKIKIQKSSNERQNLNVNASAKKSSTKPPEDLDNFDLEDEAAEPMPLGKQAKIDAA